MKEILNNLIQKSNQKIASDPAYSKKLQSVKKTICITFDNKDSYTFKIENNHISEPVEEKSDADIYVEVSSDLFKKILSKEESAMDAYLKGQLKIKASLMDKLLISDLLKS
ncbi:MULTISPECIES: SCP2 sterol-binding domain-containing protein [Acidiplasma]|jgi:putative sterol carrier protein|uniref:Sterol carrier protein n=2 Tax=Acidiplasma TaxID=507753 RepID=A0A0Q0XG52_9ARCH|nr:MULTISPECIES: SCP2 sterol-binding domain-containing protein [Acidiplasma]KJE48933.1 sterol carrier protein [Acidiplasma sp. MBA-1]KPV47590.1 sterol carrier protein [Acidiplasma aeolicum]KQB33581.1 sterol carrier protein [Acidiplasma cupricumulans]KQB35358.1 sterol carrier protein [Acidiplasma aeolicum]WMT54349.1 MAG: SCP2 sterol-binding domain-containing protein [Acidiplasma sp.]